MMSELPKLTEEGAITLNILMALFEKQLWTFAEFLNESPEKCVSTWKYVDYILYALKKEFDKTYINSKWKYPTNEEWIKTTDCSPNESAIPGRPILIWDGVAVCLVVRSKNQWWYLADGCGCGCCPCNVEFTHWTPLPEAPIIEPEC